MRINIRAVRQTSGRDQYKLYEVDDNDRLNVYLGEAFIDELMASANVQLQTLPMHAKFSVPTLSSIVSGFFGAFEASRNNSANNGAVLDFTADLEDLSWGNLT